MRSLFGVGKFQTYCISFATHKLIIGYSQHLTQSLDEGKLVIDFYNGLLKAFDTVNRF